MVKLAILCGLAFALYHQVFHEKQIPELFEQQLEGRHPAFWFWISLCVVFSPLNWGFEAAKWRLLIRRIERLSIWRALGATYVGITLGMFTPNRIGEYGGRVLSLKNEHRLGAIAPSLGGSLAQILCTLLFGILGALWFFQGSYPSPYESSWILPLSLFATIFLLAVYVSIPSTFWKASVTALISRLGLQKAWIDKSLDALNELNIRDLGLALLYSALRYMVFTAQYLFLLKAYGVKLPWEAQVSAVWMIFLLQSMVPTFAALDLIKRGAISTTVFAALFFQGGGQEFQVLAASTSLWFINLVVPALIGYIILLFTDIRGR